MFKRVQTLAAFVAACTVMTVDAKSPFTGENRDADIVHSDERSTHRAEPTIAKTDKYQSFINKDDYKPKKSAETTLWESIFGAPEEETRLSEALDKIQKKQKYSRGRLGVDA